MKKFNITVNGVSYEVEVEEVKDGTAAVQRSAVATAPPVAAKPVAKPAPKPTSKPAAPATASAGAVNVDAPMPGNIWKVLVSEGEEVKKDQVLLILEAMKMENEIVAPADGVITTIHVKEGASVNGGDILVSIK